MYSVHVYVCLRDLGLRVVPARASKAHYSLLAIGHMNSLILRSHWTTQYGTARYGTVQNTQHTRLRYRRARTSICIS